VTTRPFRTPAPGALDALQRELDACDEEIVETRAALRRAKPWRWWLFAVGVMVPIVIRGCVYSFYFGLR
jgi:hypothetical protein